MTVPIGSTDFIDMRTVRVRNHDTVIHLFTLHDVIALEYGDTILLRFTPDNYIFISDVQQFIRDTATVNIIDDDSE